VFLPGTFVAQARQIGHEHHKGIKITIPIYCWIGDVTLATLTLTLKSMNDAKPVTKSVLSNKKEEQTIHKTEIVHIHKH
jgi:hypothetical protein